MATMVEDVYYGVNYPEPDPPRRPWTVADLQSMPDDGQRYEITDGWLLVTPAPSYPHQRSVVGLTVVLHAACPADLEVFVAPADYRPDEHTSLQPDVFVVRQEDVLQTHVERPLLLAVEILSPSTRRRDLTLKLGAYERWGVASYWTFDPDELSLVVYDLVDGQYVATAKADGAEEVNVELPYPVRLCPAEIAKGSRE